MIYFKDDNLNTLHRKSQKNVHFSFRLNECSFSRGEHPDDGPSLMDDHSSFCSFPPIKIAGHQRASEEAPLTR